MTTETFYSLLFKLLAQKFQRPRGKSSGRRESWQPWEILDPPLLSEITNSPCKREIIQTYCLSIRFKPFLFNVSNFSRLWAFLVFRKKDLYLVITQKLIFWNPADFTWNPADFMKSGGFHLISCEIHPKPYKIRCFNKNSSVWGCREGAMTQDFMWNRKTTCKEL